MDADGGLIEKNIVSPFFKDDTETLEAIIAGHLDTIEGFQKLGYDVSSTYASATISTDLSLELESSEGEKLLARIMRFSDGSTALFFLNAKGQDWSEILFDDFLRETETGMVIFDRQGLMRFQRGADISEFIASHHKRSSLELAEVLLEFPKVDATDKGSSTIFDYTNSNNKVYRVRLFRNMHGWVCIIYQEVSEERRIQEQSMEVRRLRDLGQITSGVCA